MMKLIFALIVFLICACSNSESVSETVPNGSADVKEKSLLGMLRVEASGATVVLGTNSDNAPASERPEMRVKFSYDFSLGVHEVTCGEFNALMKTATGLSLDCVTDSIPATNVTYYDAVLFANERSKAEGFDTAYTYTSASFDAEKHCINIDALAYHPEKNAYRLPTEAEWVFAASQDWNVLNGWTAENSDYKLHKVGSKAKSGGFYDMVGNAMEWVNDWLGNFRDTILENFVGAPDGGALGQRIVKGGSYRNAVESINLYSRGDIYTVSSSTRADYVGFRLAHGNIPGAVWMGSDGRANSSRVIPLASSATVRSLVGTYKAKLAFRNDLSGNLAFIDYSGGILSVVEIADSIEVYHPEISPDGKHVAFCTGLEGLSGKSELYVRDLNAEGTNLVKLKVESAAIPRWRVLENEDTVIVYVTDAGNNKDDAAFKSASTWQVKFSNGKFGTPQKLFDGAYHGGISEDNTLAVTGARLFRARIAKPGSTLTEKARDTIWYKDGDDAEQACNASLSKDGTKRTLFLDFGGKTGQAFVGKSYATHERLLIADSTGTLQKSVAAPSGFTFDHSEWASGTADKVVATLTNVNGAHQKIVLLDISDSSLVELVQGDEIWHPSFWTSEKAFASNDVQLDLDSAGVYLQESCLSSLSTLRIKMEAYWKYLEQTNVILVGSSRMQRGVNPDLFPEWKMLNFGVLGIDPNRDLYFIENYVMNHLDEIKAIVLSLDFDNWHGIEDHLGYLLSAAPGFMYDANHGFWKDGVPKGFVEAVENSYPPLEAERKTFSERGNMISEVHSWDFHEIEVLNDSMVTDQRWALVDNSIARLVNIVDEVSKKNIYVIGIIFPQAPMYKKTGSIGLYGFQRSAARKLIDRLDSIDRVKSHFVLMDENKMGDHDYTDEMALNRDHLSYLGAERLTRRIDSLLKTLEW